LAPILLCYLQCWHLDFNKGYVFNWILSVLNPFHYKSLHWITYIPFHIIVYVFVVHNQCSYNTKSFQAAIQEFHASLPMWSFITRFMPDLGPWLKYQSRLGEIQFVLFNSDIDFLKILQNINTPKGRLLHNSFVVLVDQSREWATSWIFQNNSPLSPICCLQTKSQSFPIFAITLKYFWPKIAQDL